MTLRPAVLLLPALVACADASPKDTSPAPSPCAVDHWEGAPDDARVVAADGAYRSIGEALAAAVPGDTVLVDAGTWVEEVRMDVADVRLVGRCPEAVRVDGTGGTAGTLSLEADGTAAQGLTLAGGAAFGAHLTGQDTSLTAVVAEGNRLWGVATNQATAQLTDVEIVGTECLLDLCLGLVVSGGEVEADGLTVRDGTGAPIWVEGGAVVRVRDGRIQDYVSAPGTPGTAAYFDHSEVHLGPDFRVVGGEATALAAWGGSLTTEGEVELTEVRAPAGLSATAVSLAGGASLTAGPGLVVHDVEGTVLVAVDAGDIALEGATLSGLCPYDDEVTAIGVLDSTSLRLTGVEVRDSPCLGIWARDVGEDGAGVVELTQVSVEGANGVGLTLLGGGPTRLEEVTVRDTVMDGSLDFDGMGILMVGVVATLEGVRTEGNASYGLAAAVSVLDGGGLVAVDNVGAGVAFVADVVDLDGVEVTGTREAAARAWGGHGVWVSRGDATDEGLAGYEVPAHSGPEVRLADLLLTDNRGAGLVATDGVELELAAARVEGTTAGPELPGDGVVLLGSVDAILVDVWTAGNTRASVLFDASAGRVSGSGGDEAVGLVQQRCGEEVPVDVSAQVAADYAGGVHLCEGGADLPATVSPLAWNDDVGASRPPP